jgi:hypothetical protein
MFDSLLQNYKDTIQRRVGGLQRVCKFEVEGDGLAGESVSGASAEHGVDRCIRKGLIASRFHVIGWRSS